jgi:hypothetical protein
MSDEEHDNPELEPEPRIFTLSEAELTRREVEPILTEAVSCQQKLAAVEKDLSAAASRIMMRGGVIVPYEKLAKLRLKQEHLTEVIREAIDRIHATGCLVKDLDIGLLDFPAIIDNEEVYLCWKLGEDRIRFYHRQGEGFKGRKPLDPSDSGPSENIQ